VDEHAPHVEIKLELLLLLFVDGERRVSEVFVTIIPPKHQSAYLSVGVAVLLLLLLVAMAMGVTVLLLLLIAVAV
jgi:hypothetical protein